MEVSRPECIPASEYFQKTYVPKVFQYSRKFLMEANKVSALIYFDWNESLVNNVGLVENFPAPAFHFQLLLLFRSERKNAVLLISSCFLENRSRSSTSQIGLRLIRMSVSQNIEARSALFKISCFLAYYFHVNTWMSLETSEDVHLHPFLITKGCQFFCPATSIEHLITNDWCPGFLWMKAHLTA